MRVLEHTSFLRKKHMLFALLFALRPMVAMGVDRVLNVGGTAIALSETCDSEHKLNVLYDGITYCAPATTETLTNTLHVLHNGTTYSICNGSCGSGGYVMPETPPEPIVLPSTCTWQVTPNSYLFSDGNQYFDTKVPVNSRDNIEVTAQVVNGAYARLFGNKGTSCQFDMTLNKNGDVVLFMGNGSATSPYPISDSSAKIVYLTDTHKTYTSSVSKIFYANGTRLNDTTKTVKDCTDANHTMLVLDNDLTTIAQTDSGGIKLYRIRMWDKSKNLIHDFQPVPKGTNICGVTPPTNAMWDFVTKKLYYPAGTGEMGYGVDP